MCVADTKRVTRSTCGSWLHISRSHSYDPPLACVLRSSLRSSPRIVAQKRDCSQSKRIQQVFRTLLSMRSSPDPRTNRENCLRVLRKHILVVALSCRLLINMTLCNPQPIPVENLLVEDLSDGDARMGGSFKTAISRLGTGENNFFHLIVMSCNWEKPIFKDAVAVYRCNTDTSSETQGQLVGAGKRLKPEQV